MVLELIIIGGIAYYYVQKHKKEKLAKAALFQGHYQPNTYQNPPAYAGTLPPTYHDADHKQQVPVYSQQNAYHGQGVPAPPVYRDVDEKTPLNVETREVKI